jgi:hypothetical protein
MDRTRRAYPPITTIVRRREDIRKRGVAQVAKVRRSLSISRGMKLDHCQWTMRAIHVLVALSAAIILGVSSIAEAQGRPPGRPGTRPPVRTRAPELSPAAAGSAIALIVGAVLVVSEGQRRRKKLES